MSPQELCARRAELGLTQRGLADQLGVHQMTVSKWERGTHLIPQSVVLAIGMPEQSPPSRREDFFIANVRIRDVTDYPLFDIRDFATALAPPPAIQRYRFTVHGTDFVLERRREETAWTVRPAAHPDYSGVVFGDQVTAVYWAIIEAAQAWPHTGEEH
jgi:transcriptional regulator with XRE-family HTH domain